MKVHLLHADRDFDFEQDLPTHEAALRQDLELDTLLTAMAAGDQFVLDVSTKVLLSGLTDPGAIRYRQDVLADCINHPAVARELYAIAVAAIRAEKQVLFGFLRDSPDAILRRSVQVLQLLLDPLRQLRGMADQHGAGFRSEGFQRFFSAIRTELDDAYFATVADHLERLEFKGGTLISARLGAGLKGTEYMLRAPNEDRRSLLERIGLRKDPNAYTFQIADRDEAGARLLGALKARGINPTASALAQSTDHILGFFAVLRRELGFYVACLNLRERAAETGVPVAFAEPLEPEERAFTAHGIYDLCLSLATGEQLVGNQVDADGKGLVMITGANQGGKSTLLRAMGLAQLMMQCGMFVAATSLHASVSAGMFTHFAREEDATMTSGKLDEELARMSEIAGHIERGSLVLCNESFASTNEREGSQIARDIVCALLDSGVRVVFVTHLYELAHGLYRDHGDSALFLRAERDDDGRRTFKLVPGEPLPTSYGSDIYDRVFGAHEDAPASAGWR